MGIVLDNRRCRTWSSRRLPKALMGPPTPFIVRSVSSETEQTMESFSLARGSAGWERDYGSFASEYFRFSSARASLKSLSLPFLDEPFFNFTVTCGGQPA